MYPSIYGVLVFSLPSRSRLYFLFLFQLVWKFSVVVGVRDDVGVGDCQNDSIVDLFDNNGVPLHCCWSSSSCAYSVCSINIIAVTRFVHSSDTTSASVFDTSLSAHLKYTSLVRAFELTKIHLIKSFHMIIEVCVSNGLGFPPRRVRAFE